MPVSRHVSLRTRLVGVAAAAVGVSVALASAACYLSVRGILFHDLDNQLSRQAISVEAGRFRNQIPGLQGATGPLQRSGLNTPEAFQVINSNGKILIASTGPHLPVTATDKAVAAGGERQAFSSIGRTGSSDHYRVLTVSVGSGVAVQLARPLTDTDRTLGHLTWVLALVAAAGVAASLLLGYLVGRAGLTPVEDLTEAVERVGATGQLDQRIEVNGHDELSRLATSFNQMLAALDDSRRQQAQLVVDAGHELRTPLTSLRTNIEVLMRVHRLPEADRAALLADITAQLSELTTLVGDLVELARDDEQPTEPEDVRFDLVVEDSVDRARRRAPSLDFELDLRPALVRAQPSLLERAVLNVLDNAAKWSPAGSAIEVSLHRVGPRWQLQVRDHGPGIADEDLPHVFDRFYRSSSARPLPGSGLGLAIVRQVVESTGGAVSAATAAGGGAMVRIELEAVALGPTPDGAKRISDGLAKTDGKNSRDDPILMEL
ncbi:MAG: HAMP domain-containing sensor histidine kinase [Acidimicrobiales bacterium]